MILYRFLSASHSDQRMRISGIHRHLLGFILRSRWSCIEKRLLIQIHSHFLGYSAYVAASLERMEAAQVVERLTSATRVPLDRNLGSGDGEIF